MVKNNSYQELLSRFNAYFDTHLPFPIRPAALYDPCRYILEDSGKRIRPLLCLLSNQMFEGEEREDVYKVAMSLELFHNFTLIHDDIMDDAPLRRGKQTLHEKYGITSGILSGDVMNIYSYKCLAEVRPHLLKPILDLFNATAIEVCEGQQMDMDYEKKEDVCIEDYLEMIRLKTSVLLACSLKAGAILAEAHEDMANLMYEIGINLGMAFQIQDDYLDTFGNESNTGKAVGGDIRANKKTYLFLKAFEKANAQQTEKLHTLVAANSQEKVQETISLYRDLDIDKSALDLIAYYFQNVEKGIAQLQMPEEQKEEMNKLLHLLINREK